MIETDFFKWLNSLFLGFAAKKGKSHAVRWGMLVYGTVCNAESILDPWGYCLDSQGTWAPSVSWSQ